MAKDSEISLGLNGGKNDQLIMSNTATEMGN